MGFLRKDGGISSIGRFEGVSDTIATKSLDSCEFGDVSLTNKPCMYSRDTRCDVRYAGQLELRRWMDAKSVR